MEPFGKIVAVVITVIAIFFVPLLYFSQKQDVITQNYVQGVVAEFVNDVRTQGKLTQSMYNDFTDALNLTNTLYDIDLEYTHTTVAPVFDSLGRVSGTDVTYTTIYEDEILKQVFSATGSMQAGQVAGEYRFEQGDYITVSVRNDDVTPGIRMMNMFYKQNLDVHTIYATYGGEIRDENY